MFLRFRKIYETIACNLDNKNDGSGENRGIRRRRKREKRENEEKYSFSTRRKWRKVAREPKFFIRTGWRTICHDRGRGKNCGTQAAAACVPCDELISSNVAGTS